jgi:hypothetical protein
MPAFLDDDEVTVFSAVEVALRNFVVAVRGELDGVNTLLDGEMHLMLEEMRLGFIGVPTLSDCAGGSVLINIVSSLAASPPFDNAFALLDIADKPHTGMGLLFSFSSVTALWSRITLMELLISALKFLRCCDLGALSMWLGVVDAAMKGLPTLVVLLWNCAWPRECEGGGDANLNISFVASIGC